MLGRTMVERVFVSARFELGGVQKVHDDGVERVAQAAQCGMVERETRQDRV